jgi:hypothetical protein
MLVLGVCPPEKLLFLRVIEPPLLLQVDLSSVLVLQASFPITDPVTTARRQSGEGAFILSHRVSKFRIISVFVIVGT